MAQHTANKEFEITHAGEPHIMRRRLMLQKYPQIRMLYGTDATTALKALFVCLVQLSAAVYVRNWPIWRLSMLAYLLGGICYNNLTAALHECCHFLVFKKPVLNKYMAFVCNIPMGIPAAVTFRKYHQEHHSDMGVEEKDVDVPTLLEAKYVKGIFRKLLYTIFYIFFYTLRPIFVHPITPGREEVLNAVVVLGADALMFALFGWKSVLYMLLSVVLGGGLHPLAAHLIAEHYTFVKGQETYSYYGSANWFLYNVGYHNEHHDFPQIPGSRLHHLHSIAPEFYRGLAYHTSYTWVLYKFIITDAMGPWRRVKRTQREGPLVEPMGPLEGPVKSYLSPTKRVE